ncbi:MAG: ATP-binding protein [Cyanobacteria bacterium P01_F01_bin.150]
MATNQTYLSLEIERIKALLLAKAEVSLPEIRSQGSLRTLGSERINTQASQDIEQDLQTLFDTLNPPPSLVQLCQQFGLSNFEQDILLLCLGMELDSTFAPLFATLHGNDQQCYPTLSLALGALPNPDWSVLSVASPLRRWQLIELGQGRSLTSSPIRIDETILAWLTGGPRSHGNLGALDRSLQGRSKLIHAARSSPPFLVPSHQTLVQRMTSTWFRAKQPLPILQLCGGNGSDRRAIAAAACQQVGVDLCGMAIAALPSNHDDLHAIAQRWHRNAILGNSALLLEWPDDGTDPQGNAVNTAFIVSQFLSEIPTPLLISSPSQRRLDVGLSQLQAGMASKSHTPVRQRTIVTIDVRLPSTQEQIAVWQSTLAIPAEQLNGQVKRLVGQFNLNADMIQAVYLGALSQMGEQGSRGAGEQGSRGAGELEESNPKSKIQNPKSKIDEFLWHHCRIQSRHRMDHLAQRIDSAATWEDLILPDIQKDILRDVVAHLRQRMKVYQEWGFAAKSYRGLGITALFSGISGTGKTLAAEVLAEALRLDLYKIDLSAIISKYIGETEKNLSQVFDAAETGGAILLFDEADALFGKRNEVKDSHDRYANIEVSYLLQRMESYRGLAILTTNLPDAIDRAFLRRIRFIVQFPFPDVAQRLEIWQRMFPSQTPTEDIVYKKLARLNVAGGNIRNIALNAAFIAADANEPIRMNHLLDATRREYHKLELPLTDEEIRGWV